MSKHKKPRRGTNATGLHTKQPITVPNSNMLSTIAAVILFAALGAGFGLAVDGMAADLAAGPLPSVINQDDRLAVVGGRVGE